MDEMLEKNLGEQPIAKVLWALNLKTHDIVSASDENITHKMVTKACKGRRLTKNVQGKIIRAINRVSESSYSKKDLFNY